MEIFLGVLFWYLVSVILFYVRYKPTDAADYIEDAERRVKYDWVKTALEALFWPFLVVAFVLGAVFYIVTVPHQMIARAARKAKIK